MELYWSPEPELMVEVTDQKDVDKAQCYYHALDVEKLEAELAQVKADCEILVNTVLDTKNAEIEELRAKLREAMAIATTAEDKLDDEQWDKVQEYYRILKEKEEGK